MLTTNRRWAGWFAVACGVVSIVATLFLFAFFALEAPDIVESGDTGSAVLGKTNDALIGVAMLLLFPVASYLARSAGLAPTRAMLAAVLGFCGIGTTIAVQFLYLVNAIGADIQPILTGAGLALIGAWLLVLSLPSSGSELFGRVGRWLGVLAGAGHVLVGGLSIGVGPAASADPQFMTDSPVLIAAFAIGLLLWQFAFPAWAIAVGRRWRRSGTVAAMA